ncbi:hypothetical protein ACFQ60_38215 [Streptomyces zhihengii]
MDRRPRPGAGGGIGRATLYRRYGDRDRLLGEAIWSIATEEFARVHPAAAGGAPTASPNSSTPCSTPVRDSPRCGASSRSTPTPP